MSAKMGPNYFLELLFTYKEPRRRYSKSDAFTIAGKSLEHTVGSGSSRQKAGNDEDTISRATLAFPHTAPPQKFRDLSGLQCISEISL